MVIRFLYGRPLETLLATWGLSLILQQAVRTYFGPTNKDVGNPSWMSGAFELGGITITYNRMWIIVFTLAVFVALLGLLRFTRLGLEMRAVTQNRQMAASMGIRTARIDALTFGLGSGIAGIAGVALSQIDNVSPNLGQGYIIDSFMVVVFGGVGNLWGTLLGALTLGAANKFLEPFAGAVLGQIGTRGVYAHPILPDFMVFLNWDKLPFYWWGFDHFAYAAVMIVLVPGLLAFVFGWFAFRSRVTGVYFSIITQALTYALLLGFFRNDFGFGGNNGLTDFKDIMGFNVQAANTRAVLFSVSVIALGLAYYVCRAIVTSKFGKVLIAIRD